MGGIGFPHVPYRLGAALALLTIGGYPVIKKWLSYREHRVLGRPLRLEEMTYITEVVRRLKALLLMGDELDANYRAAAEKAMGRAAIESGKS